MNDFTKDELELISSGIDYWFERKYNPRVEVLLDKVQEIINNYDAQVIEVWHCEKCGHVQ